MARPENQDPRQPLFPAGEFPAQDGPDGFFDGFFQDGSLLQDGGDPWQPVMEAWARLAARAYLQARASEQAGGGEALTGSMPELSPEMSPELSPAG